jgi:hypothetical protein
MKRCFEVTVENEFTGLPLLQPVKKWSAPPQAAISALVEVPSNSMSCIGL